MKRLAVLLLLTFILGCQKKTETKKENISEDISKINVGIFDGHGGAETCKWEALEAIKLDKEMSPKMITSSDISNGILDELDAIIIPGGGGSRQYLNLGVENQKRISQFIKNGNGALGICAGAYLFSQTPKYACMGINGACAIDIEHDNRGHGLAKFTLTKQGREIFPELIKKDTCYVVYYEGPVIDPTKVDKFKTFAMMQSDVHEEGDAPTNMTNNKPFFIGNEYGKGRVFSSIAHPEATPGMRWMIPRIIRWTIRKTNLGTYSANAVRPNRFDKEILFTKEMLKKESECYQTLLYGSDDQKIEVIEWLKNNVSWSGKRWIQGLVYDKSPKVRVAASKYIADSEFTHYIPDVQSAYNNEKDEKAKAMLKKSLEFLKSL